ncbi:MAG: hypothetical protein WC565_08655 [Parcubacteria group bacterium]|jgi:hypothetical protein
MQPQEEDKNAGRTRRRDQRRYMTTDKKKPQKKPHGKIADGNWAKK